MNINEQFGLHLRQLRLSRSWSQEELGAKCDLDRTYISGIERGVRNPTLSVIAAIASGLQIPIKSLFP
jgi:transcriptional regulator with XRE-family HTH domain